MPTHELSEIDKIRGAYSDTGILDGGVPLINKVLSPWQLLLDSKFCEPKDDSRRGPY